MVVSSRQLETQVCSSGEESRFDVCFAEVTVKAMRMADACGERTHRQVKQRLGAPWASATLEEHAQGGETAPHGRRPERGLRKLTDKPKS